SRQEGPDDGRQLSVSAISRNGAGAALAFLFLGCGHSPPDSADTGAKKAALDFCDAIIARDWDKAYDLVDGDTRKRWTRAAFEHVAQGYRRLVGFEPTRARLKACEEQEGKATAHVVFSAGAHTYRDGLLLRRSDGAWRVVLPTNFGRKTAP